MCESFSPRTQFRIPSTGSQGSNRAMNTSEFPTSIGRSSSPKHDFPVHNNYTSSNSNGSVDFSPYPPSSPGSPGGGFGGGGHPPPPPGSTAAQQQQQQDLTIDGIQNQFPHRRSRASRTFKNPPQPHMCIKEKTIDGKEVFINVLSWTRIANPDNPDAPIPLYGGMKVGKVSRPRNTKTSSSKRSFFCCLALGDSHGTNSRAIWVNIVHSDCLPSLPLDAAEWQSVCYLVVGRLTYIKKVLPCVRFPFGLNSVVVAFVLYLCTSSLVVFNVLENNETRYLKHCVQHTLVDRFSVCAFNS